MASHNNALANALSQLNLIFPTLALPALTSTTSLHDLLPKICQCLPEPDPASRQNALCTMRHIIDQQEYKYQRSLLTDSFTEEALFEECFYEQPSTGLSRKETGFTHADKQDMVDDVWGWKEDKVEEQEDYMLFID